MLKLMVVGEKVASDPSRHGVRHKPKAATTLGSRFEMELLDIR
jgi:hypothetical protein